VSLVVDVDATLVAHSDKGTPRPRSNAAMGFIRCGRSSTTARRVFVPNDHSRRLLASRLLLLHLAIVFAWNAPRACTYGAPAASDSARADTADDR
jgi:hypothetical protein